VPKWQHKI